MSRGEALELAKDTLLRARQAAVEQGLGDIIFCPETMGKVNQLGDLDEVLELCSLDDSFLPCIDFGHLNARTFGQIQGKEDYEKILDAIGNKLGTDRLVAKKQLSPIFICESAGTQDDDALTMKRCYLEYAL